MKPETAITVIEEIRPKKCKMVNGKLQGGFPDHSNWNRDITNPYCHHCGQAILWEDEE